MAEGMEDISQEEVKGIETKVLNGLRNYLCDHLEPERFFPYLQSKNYLDADSCEMIRNAGTTKSRVNRMLDILIRSALQPLKVLKKAIERSGRTQLFVARKLEEEFAIELKHFKILRQQGLWPGHVPPTSPPPYELSRPRTLPPPSVFPTMGNGFSAGKFGSPPSYVPKDHSDLPFDSSQFAPMPLHSYFHTAEFPPSSIYPSGKIAADAHDLLQADSQIKSDQERELRTIQKKQPVRNSDSVLVDKRWTRSPRTPSEHDASVVPIRQSPTPTSPPNARSPSPSKPILGASSIASDENSSPRARNLKSMMSQPGSIQPSCFTSSNFDSMKHRTQNLSPSPSYPKSPESPSLQHSPSRQFSNHLPPIPSIPGVENSVNSVGIASAMRIQPTEHDDASILTQSTMERDESSLEISTDEEDIDSEPSCQEGCRPVVQ